MRLLVLALLATHPALPEARPMRRIEVQGHRGARALRPENTLPAFRYALEVGVDTLELDVHVTADDVLVVTHDPLLSPELCSRGGKPLPAPLLVRGVRASELKDIDCGARTNPRFPRQQAVPGTPVPALEEVLALVKSAPGSAVKLNIETKSVPAHPEWAPPPDHFAALVVGLIEKSGLADRCVLQSFDHRTLLEAHKLAPKLTTAVLTSENWLDYVAVARAARAQIVSPDKDWLTLGAVQAIHAAGLRVIPWTANTPEEWQRLVDLGADGIITDDPAALISFLKQRGLR